MPAYDEKPRTTLTENSSQFFAQASKSSYSVLCGRNNCGKSYLLKLLYSKLGDKASYLGPARYQNFSVLTPYSPSRNKREEKYRQWLRQWQEATQNIDNSPFSLQQAIAELSDSKRAQLSEIMKSLLGATMDTPHTVPDNSMSQQYVSVNGYNVSFTSSGFRLIASLVTSLLSDEYDTYLIDEPELGISPEAQGAFSEFLFDAGMRERYFPHVRSLVLATHSTVFLDRRTITNNYFVRKSGEAIDVERVANVSDINRIHFFLLGNRLESLYMPSAIVIVEGKTDFAFIERVLSVKFSNARFSVIHANGDSRVRDVFNVTKNLFGDIQKSPYRDRIFAVLDSVHGTGLRGHLEGMGMPAENIIVWSKNGIEHYYPEEVMSSIFHAELRPRISKDCVELNGLTYSKQELSELVVPKIQAATKYSDEFNIEFLSKIEGVLG